MIFSHEGFFKAILLVSIVSLVIFGLKYLKRRLVCNSNSRYWIRGFGITQLVVSLTSIPIFLHFVESGIVLDISLEFLVPLLIYYVSFMMLSLSVPEVFIGDDSIRKTFGEEGLIEMADARKCLSLMTMASLSFWLVVPYFSGVLDYAQHLGVLSYNLMLIECLFYSGWVCTTILTFIVSGALSLFPIDKPEESL